MVVDLVINFLFRVSLTRLVHAFYLLHASYKPLTRLLQCCACSSSCSSLDPDVYLEHGGLQCAGWQMLFFLSNALPIIYNFYFSNA